MLPTAIFYIFATLLLVSSFFVVFVRNTVHSVFFLIFAFFNAAGLFVLAGAEFLAMVLVIVYVGAVAVLFLFVVMMLGVNFATLREKSKRYMMVGGLVGGIFCAELIFAVGSWIVFPEAFHLGSIPILEKASTTNTHEIGNVLYTHYFLPFQLSGLILLVAMIGAIVLTLRLREDVRHQSIRRQVEQTKKEAVTLVNAPLGKGV